MSDVNDGPGANPAPGAEQSPGVPPAGMPYGQPAGGYPPVYAAPKTNGLAILSLVMGILSMVLCPLTGIVGLWAGFSARRAIRQSNGAETGEGVALAGIVTSVLGFVVVGIAVAAIIAVTLLGTSASSKFSSIGTAIS